MESGPDVFGKLSLVMTLLTNLRVTEILCSFTLVLKKNTGKGVIKIIVPRKSFQLAILLYQMQNRAPPSC